MRKSFSKIDFLYRENFLVTAFWKGLAAQDAANLAAIQSECDVPMSKKIVASVTVFSPTPHARTSLARRYNSNTNRHLTSGAMEEEGDDQIKG